MIRTPIRIALLLTALLVVNGGLVGMLAALYPACLAEKVPPAEVISMSELDR